MPVRDRPENERAELEGSDDAAKVFANRPDSIRWQDVNLHLGHFVPKIRREVEDLPNLAVLCNSDSRESHKDFISNKLQAPIFDGTLTFHIGLVKTIL